MVLVTFRQHIGEEEMERLLKESISVNEPLQPKGGYYIKPGYDSAGEKHKYPKDDNQYKKTIKTCWKIADKENILLQQLYRMIIN